MENNNPNSSPENSSNLVSMKQEIHRLEIEKQKLENELKSREELMTSLFSYIQSGGK